MREGQLLGDQAAEREAENVNAIVPEVIEQGHGVRRHLLGAVRPLGPIGAPCASAVEGHHPEAARERPDLRRPAPDVEPEPVDEQERWAVAVDLVVKFDSPGPAFGHVLLDAARVSTVTVRKSLTLPLGQTAHSLSWRET